MRMRILLLATVLAVLGAGIFGAVKRQTYTDKAKEDGYLNKLQVGEISTWVAERVSEVFPERVSEGTEYILRVKIVGELEHKFAADRQRVCIQEVYAGSGVECGQELYLHSRGWCFSINPPPISIERNFVNVLQVGKEYLVFGEQLMEDPGGDLTTLIMTDAGVLAPVFCYEPIENTVVRPVSPDGSTYVSYELVKDNEFFVASEGAKEILEGLKAKYIAMYPPGGSQR